MEILGKSGASIPTTVEELIATAKKVRAAGFQPLATGGNDWTGFSLFTLITQTRITHDGWSSFTRRGRFSANPDFVEGVRLFTRLRDEGVFIDNAEGLNFDTQNEAFFSGKAAMLHGGSWSFGDLPKEMAGKVELGGFPLPEGSPLAKPAYYYEFTAKGVWVTRNWRQEARRRQDVPRGLLHARGPGHVRLLLAGRGGRRPTPPP
ncbi:MAG: extracellular solute-binding protein [Acidimicrobiia bacterium]|nr:extracellular solute-binding protein [Acidimicrobiia bacterium]